MSVQKANEINYAVACVNEFSKHHGISVKDAFLYLHKYQGIQFLKEFYEVEHTLSFDDVIEDLTKICTNNGGNLS